MACGGDGGVSKDCVEQVVLNKGAADVHSCRPVLVFPTFYNNRNSQFLKIYFIEVWLIYNVVLISAVQQSDSVIHIYIYTFFFIFFSMMVYHRILNIVPCAIQ